MAVNRALLVGIDAYEAQPLAGCVRDINHLAALLLDQQRFSFGEIRLLADGQATRRAIVDGLRWLLADASPGDRLYFHFSGHGAQAPSGCADELCEVLCPVDFDWSPERALSGCDVAGLLAALPDGANLTWTLDASFDSGRASDLGCEGPALRARTLRAPATLRREIERRGELGGARPLLSARMAERALAIAACWSNEIAWEAPLDGSQRGAFTRALVRALRLPTGAISPVSALPQMLRGALTLFGQHAVADGPRSEMSRAFLGDEVLSSIPAGRLESMGRFDIEELDFPVSRPVPRSARGGMPKACALAG